MTKELSSPRVEFFKDSANEIKAKFMTYSTEASDCGDIESEDIECEDMATTPRVESEYVIRSGFPFFQTW